MAALVTSIGWPDLAPDDRLIAPALARVDVDTEIAIWTDARVAWERFDLIVVRSCWDYHDDLPRWLEWIAGIERRGLGARLCNPATVLRWNARKTYLSDLAARGVPVVPTRWLAAPDLTSWMALQAALVATGWDDLVLKPAVSAGALGTFHLRVEDLSLSRDALTAALPELARRGPVLVQPYIGEIATEGEWSLLFFDGQLSHTVQKRPAPGDFRVQEKHGGTTISATPPPSLVAVSRRALAAAAEATSSGPDVAPFLYARADLIISGGRPLLIELEVTEPALFLQAAPVSSAHDSAAQRLAKAIAARISAVPRMADR